MLRDKTDLNEKELEEPEGKETPATGGIEVPKEEAPEPCEAEEPRDECRKETQEDPNQFTARIVLDSELIASASVQGVITVLDDQLRTIREAAIKRITEIKS